MDRGIHHHCMLPSGYSTLNTPEPGARRITEREGIGSAAPGGYGSAYSFDSRAFFRGDVDRGLLVVEADRGGLGGVVVRLTASLSVCCF
mmetsp:Transcript_594/g.700  ORF Transcript_594/g.700 Transcript_594/m.700 type:complete len:89 (-) Transcript_594:99-365(-)